MSELIDPRHPFNKQINTIKTAFNKREAPENLTTMQIEGVTVRIDGEKSLAALQDLIGRLQQIPAGREVLDVLREQGVPLQMQGGLGGTFGYFSPDPSNMHICLNSDRDLNKICSTLVHETHHLMQHLQDPTADRFVLNLKSQIMLDRAKEADSQTWALRACREWAALGNDKPYEQFKYFYPEIAEAFEIALANNNGIEDDKVWTETFKGWYKQDGVRTLYEGGYMTKPAVVDLSTRDYLSATEKAAERAANPADPQIFYYEADKKLRDLSTQEVINITGYKYFVEDPSVLESDELLGVLKYTKDTMSYLFDRAGIPDKTAKGLPVSKGLKQEAGYVLGQNYQILNQLRNRYALDAEMETGVSVRQLMRLSVEERKQKLEEAGASPEAYEKIRRVALLDADLARFGLLDKQINASTKKESKEIGAELAKAESRLLACAFVEEYRETKPELVASLLASENLSDDVRKALAEADTLYKPTGKPQEPVTAADKKQLIMLNKALAKRNAEIAKIENKKTVVNAAVAAKAAANDR